MNIYNLDLLSVGITVASIGILGFIVYLGEQKSRTNRAFLFFSIVTILWGVFNYLSYNVQSPTLILWFLRVVIFLAVWHAYSLFLLLTVIGNEEQLVSKKHKRILIPLVAVSSLINLTPLAFQKISTLSESGVSTVVKGPGMLIFLLLVVFLILTAFFRLIQKVRHSTGVTRTQLKFVLIGLSITFAMLAAFNFLLPAIFDYVRFIPLGAIFIIPFVAFTFYAIIKHHLLDIKVISTEILTFVLAVVSLAEIVFSHGFLQILFRSGVFILVLSFGFLLIKSITREVEQRERLQKLSDELAAANEKLKLADRMKTQFLSFASHQVKSPMTVVQDYAELIRDGTFGAVPEKVKETAEKIREAAIRLLELVGNLLDLRKLEEGKIEYHFEKTDFSAMMKSIYEEMKTLSDAKKLELTLEAPAEPIMVNADASKLRQVIQNLIDNSIKYTETGWIKIQVLVQTSNIKVTVSDSGIGIPQDLIPKLFEQFNRGSDAAKKIQGTGLGLYIAKQFMEAHHGTVWAESDGVGKGSRFVIQLPYDTN